MEKLKESILNHHNDNTETKEMPDVVRGLAKRSAGIAILFETDSTFIRAKRQLTGEVYLPNMIPFAHTGDYRLGQNVNGQNEAIWKTSERLLREGYKNIYYVGAGDLVGHDHEATIDGIYLTDVGCMRLATQLVGVLEKLF